MKTLVAGLLLSALFAGANANPSKAIVEACLRTESVSPGVRYTPIEVRTFEVIEDGDAGKTSTVLRYGKDTVGIWEAKRPLMFGLVFNGRETPLSGIVRLDKEEEPISFNPYEAIWGLARDNKKSYICATFNFEGLGKSGSFQNVRGLYLIERSKRAKYPFYIIGSGAHGKD